jgi:hypothetical protein
MAKQTLSTDIRRYALAGAQARLTEISLEFEAIRRAFPELRQNGRQTEATGGDEPKTRARRLRRTMTAAQRKAVGERMTKYWAARRGGSETTGTTSSDSAEKASKTARGAVKRGPRNMSPEARKRISDAQKARWAAQRSGAKAASASESSEAPSAATRTRRRAVKARTRAAKRGPRKVSAAARKRMSQAQKKRWAAKRKAA